MMRQGVLAPAAGDIGPIACYAVACGQRGPVPGDGPLHRVAARGGLQGAEGSFLPGTAAEPGAPDPEMHAVTAPAPQVIGKHAGVMADPDMPGCAAR